MTATLGGAGARLWDELHETATLHSGPWGWVCPPPWSAVAVSRGALSGDVLVLSTGGWAFAAEALGSERVRVLDSLDPHAIGAQPRPDTCLAISESGSTVETRRLAEAFTDRPVRWLTGPALSPRGRRDQVAMLGAPLSTAFLLPAALAYPDQFEDAYLSLLAEHNRLAARAAEAAAEGGDTYLTVAAPEWANDGLRRWLLQLGRQVICGKSATFRPRFELTADGPGASLDLSGEAPGLRGLMRVMYTAGVFAACVALRAGVAPAEHGNVTAYKRMIGTRVKPMTVAPPALPGFAAAWLAGRPEIAGLHVVRYGGAPAPLPSAPALSVATGRRCEVHHGSAWNHHSVLVLADPVQDGPYRAQAQTLRDIADATCAALPGRSVVVEPARGG
jgi:hypothetical protein